MNVKLSIFFVLMVFVRLLSSCETGPDPIHYGKDNCYYCKMTISDNHFGAVVLTTKGKSFKYDDLGCLLNQSKEGGLEKKNVKDYFVTNFVGNHELLSVKGCQLFKSEQLHSPMNGNIIAFPNTDSLKAFQNKLSGEVLDWNELIK